MHYRLANTTGTMFLDASLHLYERVCPSVGSSVRPSVTRFFSKIAKTRFDFGRREEGEGRARGWWRGAEGVWKGVTREAACKEHEGGRI